MSNRAAAALILFAALLAACGDCQESTGDGASSTGRIALVSASTLSIKVDVAGKSVIQVVVPEGSPGAGTYTTDSADLLDDAHAAMEVFGEQGAEVHIEVDEAGEIIKLGHTVEVR